MSEFVFKGYGFTDSDRELMAAQNESGLTQKQLAEEWGVSLSTVVYHLTQYRSVQRVAG